MESEEPAQSRGNVVLLCAIALAVVFLSSVLLSNGARGGRSESHRPVPEPSTTFVGVCVIGGKGDVEVAVQTVNRLFATARWPHNLTVGLLIHATDIPRATNALEWIDAEWRSSVRDIVAPIESAEGPWAAKQTVLKLWHNERFILLVDAHADFAANWDSSLMGDLLCTPKEDRGKAISCLLTTIPPNEDTIDLTDEDDRVLMATWPTWANGLAMPAAKVMFKSTAAPLPTTVAAGCFLYGPSSVLEPIQSVPFPKGAYQYGDLLLSTWLFNKGWRFFAPTEAYLSMNWNMPSSMGLRCKASETAAAAASALSLVDGEGDKGESYANWAEVDVAKMKPGRRAERGLTPRATHEELLCKLGRMAIISSPSAGH